MKVISVENLSKAYRLGQIGTGTLTNDLKVWWARMRGTWRPILLPRQAQHKAPYWRESSWQS
jgi:lipopolysaccharide transport system ATP-binding protein